MSESNYPRRPRAGRVSNRENFEPASYAGGEPRQESFEAAPYAGGEPRQENFEAAPYAGGVPNSEYFEPTVYTGEALAPEGFNAPSRSASLTWVWILACGVAQLLFFMIVNPGVMIVPVAVNFLVFCLLAGSALLSPKNKKLAAVLTSLAVVGLVFLFTYTRERWLTIGNICSVVVVITIIIRLFTGNPRFVVHYYLSIANLAIAGIGLVFSLLRYYSSLILNLYSLAMWLLLPLALFLYCRMPELKVNRKQPIRTEASPKEPDITSAEPPVLRFGKQMIWFLAKLAIGVTLGLVVGFSGGDGAPVAALVGVCIGFAFGWQLVWSAITGSIVAGAYYGLFKTWFTGVNSSGFMYGWLRMFLMLIVAVFFGYFNLVREIFQIIKSIQLQ